MAAQVFRILFRFNNVRLVTMSACKRFEFIAREFRRDDVNAKLHFSFPLNEKPAAQSATGNKFAVSFLLFDEFQLSHSRSGIAGRFGAEGDTSKVRGWNNQLLTRIGNPPVRSALVHA